AELLDRLVRYRNTGLAHAAPGRLKDDFHTRMAAALLAGAAEVLGRVDVLAGHRLQYVGEVRQAGGVWLVPRYELAGKSACRIASLELPWEQAPRLPVRERLYLDEPGPSGGELPPLSLPPLLVY